MLVSESVEFLTVDKADECQSSFTEIKQTQFPKRQSMCSSPDKHLFQWQGCHRISVELDGQLLAYFQDPLLCPEIHTVIQLVIPNGKRIN